MTDLGPTLRRLSAVYSDSYPPSVLAGGAPDPQIASLAPTTVSAAAGPTTITVTGTDFEATSVVEVNQAAQPTTFVDAGHLTISYDPTVAGTVQFTVRNTSGQESNSVPFVVSSGAEGFARAAAPELTPDEPEPPAPGPASGGGSAPRRRRSDP